MSDSVAYFALHTRVGPTFVHILGRVSLRTGPSTCVCFRDRTLCGYPRYRDTLCFLLATCSPEEGNIIRFRTEFLGAPGGDCGGGACTSTVHKCTFGCGLFPLRCCWSGLAGSRQNFWIVGLFQLCPLRDHSRYGRLPQAFSGEDNLVKLGKFSTHTSYALVLWTQDFAQKFQWDILLSTEPN